MWPVVLPPAANQWGSTFRALHFNVTMLNQKAISYFAEMEPDERPALVSVVETHLSGAALNRARRVLQKIGWRSFTTPAMQKAEQAARIGEAPAAPADVLPEARGKYHNTGGEAVLVDPGRKASGYHQAKEHFGFRSVLVRMKGWTLHYIAAYFDSGWPFEAGPNALKWQAILGLITSMNLPWIIAADCNRTPDEVAHSTFVRFLKGVVVAPAVEFTCASAPPPGRVIDMVISCKACVPYLQVLPYYAHPFKPHVVGLDIRLALDIDIVMAKAQVVPDEVVQYSGPRNELDTWEYHFMAFEGHRAQIDAPWSTAANSRITDLYARWSLANESYLLSQSPHGLFQANGQSELYSI